VGHAPADCWEKVIVSHPLAKNYLDFDVLIGFLYSINWYQRNYLFAWVGARLVRDVQ
jgi:hypothetical protein